MEILISKMATKDGEQWSVKAGTIALTFKDQASAVEFSEKLKERIEAPHDLPLAQLERLVEALENETGRRQKLSATPDLSGTVLPLCLIPNSALKNAPPFKSAVPKGSACARLLA